MGDEETLDNDDFDLEDEELEQEAEEKIQVTDSDMRRRLEDELEERRLQKMILDYDFDLD
jgi:hypothetical protein